MANNTYGLGYLSLFYIERSTFELLFGVLGHNFSFSLTLKAGYELQGLPDNLFFRLCDILNLKAGKEGLTSSKFLQYVAKKNSDNL